jgi:outer membrane cobalamin receptor
MKKNSGYIVAAALAIPMTAASISVADEGGLQLEEVMVTAQRRAQDVRDVPIAITVVGGGRYARPGHV